MCLDYLIPLYYTDEWENLLDNGICNVLNQHYSEAYSYISNDMREAIENDHFHDWLLLSVCIYQSSNTCVKILVAHDNVKRTLSFEDIISFKIEGTFSTDAMAFPISTNEVSAIAQIMDVWITYNGEVEYIILLNDNRYMKIVAKKFRLFKHLSSVRTGLD